MRKRRKKEVEKCKEKEQGKGRGKICRRKASNSTVKRKHKRSCHKSNRVKIQEVKRQT